MEFRWVALIALWTLVSGPLLGVPMGSASRDQAKAKVAKVTLPTAKVPGHAR